MNAASVLLILIYMTPSLIGFIRWQQPFSVAFVNYLFGWTVIGWFIAFAMACKPYTPKQIEERMI